MHLDLFNNITGKIESRSEAKSFVNQLKEHIDSFSKSIINNDKAAENINDTMLLEQIQAKNKTSLESSLKMIDKRDEIIEQYAKESIDNGDLYYIINKSNANGNYKVFKYDGNSYEKLEKTGIRFPKDVMVNTAMRLTDNKFVIDKEATVNINKKIIEPALEILKEQNEKISSYRKEGSLYCITNDVYDRVYLTNLKTNERFEEVDFPQDLLEDAILGSVVKFENNKYEIITKSKYQQGVQVKENNEINNEKQEGTLYCVSEAEYYVGLINLNNGEEFEAKDIPVELKEKLSKGTILKYEGSGYKIKENS